MEIEVGKLYYKKKGSRATVRLVTLLENDKVHYQVMYGPALKKHQTGCTTKKGFTRWACGLYTGDGDFQKLDGAKINGVPEFRCGQKRANFYLKKGYARRINDSTIRLNSPVTVERFHQLYEILNPFFMAVKNDKCVVCGCDAPLTRHHVVPRRVLKLIPNKIKRRMSNILFVCVKCHTKYNENDITTEESDPRVWLSHFIKVMNPKFMPEGWDIFMIKEGVLDENGDPPPLCSCFHCDGTGAADSGGFTPWGEPINIPCPFCTPEHSVSETEQGQSSTE
jgi:hypothetical protein